MNFENPYAGHWEHAPAKQLAEVHFRLGDERFRAQDQELARQAVLLAQPLSPRRASRMRALAEEDIDVHRVEIIRILTGLMLGKARFHPENN